MCVLWTQMQFYDIHAHEGEHFSFVYSRGGKTLHGYRSDVGEVAPKLLVLPRFHKLVTFRGKSPSD